MPYRNERLSLNDYLTLPPDDAWHDELVGGRLVREPRPGAEHAWIQARLTGRLVRYAEEYGGLALVDAGYVLSADPPTVRGPDISYIRSERAPAGPPRGLLSLAPDVAIEVLSPSNRPAEMRRKVRDYLRAGVGLVWVVDPPTRSATEYAPGCNPRALSGEDELDGGDVLPGFRLRLAELFAG